MKWRKVVIAAVLGSLFAVAAGWAQHQPVISDNARFGDPTSTARTYEGYLYGVIKSVKSDELVLAKTQYGLDKTFKLQRKTKYVRDGKPSSFAKLKVGDQVWVDAKKDKKSGEMIARKVLSGVGATN